MAEDVSPDDQSIGSDRMWFPSPETLNPAEFERFIAETFGQLVARDVAEPHVQVHELVTGVDGDYDFDATVRCRLGELDFLILVEAKQHRHPIKRDVVQVLESKVRSVGAQKGVIFSTAPFQRGAITYATTHGIALVKVSDGGWTYEVRADGLPPSRRAPGGGVTGRPDLVGHSYEASGPNSVAITVVTDEPDHAAEQLLGRHAG